MVLLQDGACCPECRVQLSHPQPREGGVALQPRQRRTCVVSRFPAQPPILPTGMLPVFYSEVAAREKQQGWRRAGYDVLYYKTAETNPRSGKPHYALSFKLKFEHPEDVCYLAYCVPYTYSDYVADLGVMMADEARGRFITKEVRRAFVGHVHHPNLNTFVQVMCKTLGGKTVDLLTITEPEQSTHGRSSEDRGVPMAQRQACHMHLWPSVRSESACRGRAGGLHQRTGASWGVQRKLDDEGRLRVPHWGIQRGLLPPKTISLPDRPDAQPGWCGPREL